MKERGREGTGMRLVAAMLGCALAWPALAADYRAGGIDVSAAWSRATFGPGATAVAYMTIDNAGAADALTGIRCAGAQAVTLHDEASGSMTMPGMAAMRTDSMPLLDRIDIPAHGRVQLQPGGKHAMLANMAGTLAVGQSVACVLQFRGAGPLNVLLTVARAGATAAP